MRQKSLALLIILIKKKSCGHDGINNIVLKYIVLEIVQPLTHVFNLSISSGIVPDDMKLAKVIPVFKKGDEKETNNYRPISLLSCLSKILEKVIYSRTIDFLQHHNIFFDSQFGFREKHNTTHAILTLIDKIAQASDQHCHTLGVFLDFSKAFDTINHDILLYKLSYYGIRGKALEWFRSYLQNRKQFVTVQNKDSSTHDINCGVPQGSLLGPLLFIIYINDFHKSSPRLSFLHFADDSSIFFSHRNPNYLVDTLNNEFKLASDWIKSNKLSLNLQKTNYMLFSNSLNNIPGDIMFDNTLINKESQIKFLGVILDDKLSWKSHTINICKIISRNIGIINKLKWFLPQTVLLTLYSTLVLPYLNYGILAWGNSMATQLQKILLLQKKVMRIICRSDFRAHTDSLFKSNNILKVSDIYTLNLGSFMFQLNKRDLPKVFYNMFNTNNQFHSYPTRQSSFYHLPRTRTLFANKIFTNSGPKFWNSLSSEIRECNTIYTFKRKLKTLLINAYENI